MSKSFQISRRSFIRNCTLTAAATGLPLWFVERELASAAEPAPIGDVVAFPICNFIWLNPGHTDLESQQGGLLSICGKSRPDLLLECIPTNMLVYPIYL